LELRVIPKDDGDPALSKFKSKFSLPTRPSDNPPELPDHLDDLDDSDLMDLYTEFMSWVSYTKGQLVQAEIDEDRPLLRHVETPTIGLLLSKRSIKFLELIVNSLKLYLNPVNAGPSCFRES